ncbi:transporter substrate-binding domain-containing protein [Candidatus Magnetaquicoccus inordinatus]|uniref:transporter substrate-binding domain-containing protein n=1 Tax=Candidatus Magnetaquicoccus inordinatus TaxID=2496818 RepID=UPI00187D2122|nr:transporter substrate-binding domain-containing protein [Candidatus Magnetaquicoccus inordinatus]
MSWFCRPLIRLLLILALFLSAYPVHAGNNSIGRTVKVGVYQNEPGVFADKNGAIKGFYIDLLEHTAAKHDWKLEYIFGTWAESYQRLQNGEIDLQVAIAHTPERAEQFDFSDETAFSNWGQIYVWNPDLDALPKLKDRIVAGMRDDVYYTRFKALVAQLGIKIFPLDQVDYEAVLQAVADNDADAGIISRSAGMMIDKGYAAHKSPIVCCPMEVRFAAPKGRSTDLLKALDRDLHAMKADSESLYYTSFNVWYEGGSKKPFPKWVLPVAAGAVGMLVLLFVGNLLLRRQVRARTIELEKEIVIRQQAEVAMRVAMRNLLTLQVAPGVFWLQIPEAGLYILCGCPSEVVKHLMRRGYISTTSKDGVSFETGPNVILLSDVLVQNGGFANLAEFPVLQMLYRQGIIIPKHPNNTGIKPLLIGSAAQVRAQMAYIYRGNYGLISKEEILASGIDEELAEIMMRIKLKFAFGTIRSPADFLDTLEVEDKPLEIRNGVTVERSGFNRYTFSFRGESTEVDLNLPPGVSYESPYPLGRHQLKQHHFAVIHTGEGDGWDVNRPSMGSMIMFRGRIYLIDASPGILQSLSALGLDINDVEGIFHTHAHDDHFAGLPALIQTDQRLKYFATPLVRSSVSKKFAALMSLSEDKFAQLFQIRDLKFAEWNDCDGLQVMPIYSPHPLETSLFLFRAWDEENNEHTYAHWADLSAFKVLDGMVGDGAGQVSAAFMEKIKEDYLRPATLKKLDIGGGMIHGVAEDFRHDKSKRLILAHIARNLTTQEMEIGSESSFGAEDVLIPGDRDYRLERAERYLQEIFPTAPLSEIRELLACPVVDHNAGTIIRRGRRDNDEHEQLDMIVSGTVAYLNASANVMNLLAFGSFIGGESLFGSQPERAVDKSHNDGSVEEQTSHEHSADRSICRRQWTYRTVSHCSVIQFATEQMRAFLIRNGLMEQMVARMAKVSFLRKTWLFGEHTTPLTLGRIAGAMERMVLSNSGVVPAQQGAHLWLIEQGEISCVDRAGRIVEVVRTGGFFGEQSYLDPQRSQWQFRHEQEVVLHCVQWEHLLDVPIVYWKLLEVFEKRQKQITA